MHVQLDGVWHALQLEVRLRELRVRLGVDVAIDRYMLGRLPLRDVLRVDDLCLLRPLSALALAPEEGALALGDGGAIDVRLWPLGAPLVPPPNRSAAARAGRGVVASHLAIRSLPPALPTVTRTLLQVLDDRYLSPLLGGAHRTCDLARKAVPPIAPPAMPPPAAPPSLSLIHI